MTQDEIDSTEMTILPATSIAATIPNAMTIAEDWINKRDELLGEASKTLDLEQASFLLKRITSHGTLLEKNRSIMMKPVRDFTKNVKAMFDENGQPLLDAKQGLKDIIDAFREKEAEAAAEVERIHAEAEKAEQQIIIDQQAKNDMINAFADSDIEPAEFAPDLPEVAPVPETPVTAPSFGIKTRIDVEFELVDITNVPLNLIILDEKAVREQINKAKKEIIAQVKSGEQPIPGLTLTIKKSTSS